MKSYSKFEGVIPDGVKITIESDLVRLFFDFYHNKIEIDGEEYDQLVCENVDVIGRTYDDMVSAIIVDHYPIDKREAIMANYYEANNSDSIFSEIKKEEYIKEYKEFQQWRKHAKDIATEVLSKIQ